MHGNFLGSALEFGIIYATAGPDTPTGFLEYMYSSIIPACFLAPSKPEFELSDGQSYLVCNDEFR
jgi:hypothetical protein